MVKRRGTRPAPRGTSVPEKTAAAPGRVWLCATLLAVSGALVYSNSLSAPFTFDDQVSVIDNRQIRRLWPLWDALSPPGGGWPVSGRPLVNLSLATNYALGGLNVRGYHVVNIGLHVLCALLLFDLVRRTLSLPALAHRFRTGTSVRLALVCALMWTVHPLQTETIDYISKRSELMMSLFYLLTLHGSVRAAGPEGSRVWLAVSALSCALGMACKESMVTAPLTVLLFDAIFVFRSLPEALRQRGAYYGALAASWMVLGALIWSRPRGDTAGLTSGAASWTYLLNQSTMIVRYLSLAFWPRLLVLDYGEPRLVTLPSTTPYLIAIFILLSIIGMALVRWRSFGFLGACFFVILAPTSSFVPIATEVGSESRMYLPLAALVCSSVIGGHLLYRRLWTSDGTQPHIRWISRCAMTAIVLVCVMLSMETFRRNAEYQSEVTLWRTVVERWPHARAHRNLAQALRSAGALDEAVLHLREAVRDRPEARYALGQVLFDQGRVNDAIEELRRAIADRPADANATAARIVLGRALASQGRPAEAAPEFRLVLERAPTDSVAQGGLADALFAQGDFPGASNNTRNI